MNYINFHTHHPSLKTQVTEVVNLEIDAFNQSREYDSFFSLGIHPWNIDNEWHEKLGKINEAAKNPDFLCIGECGLDKMRGPELSIQTEVFKAHIQLSEDFKKPLIIHCVKAYSEIIKLRKDLNPAQAWIFHGFNASPDTLKQALNFGFFFSFGPEILKDSDKVRQSLEQVPKDRFFMETDDRDNHIDEIYRKASVMLNVELSQLKQVIYSNFNNLFNIKL